MLNGAQITGVKEMQERMKRIALKFPLSAARALYLRGEAVMTRSKREFVPVAEDRGGTLRASGHVHPPEIEGKHLRVCLSYGGPADAYAIAVHEHLSQYSPPSWQIAEDRGTGVTFHPEGRGPKYLETPLMEAVATLAEDLATDIDLRKVAE